MKTKSLSSDVTVKLKTADGTEEYSLRSSLRAATTISNQFGGFIGAYQQLAAGSLQAVQFIIRTGIPKEELRNVSTDELNEMVFRTGTVKLITPLTKYLGRLQNGGRDPDEEPDDGDEDDSGNGEI